MENKVLDRVELKDGTEIRSYKDEIESESPLAWNDEIRYYTNRHDYDKTLLPTHDIKELANDYRGKKNIWVVQAQIQCGSCPGMFLSTWINRKATRLSKLKLDKFIELMNDPKFMGDDSEGLLVFKAKDEKEAWEMAISIKKNMDIWLCGDVLTLDHGKVVKCGSCGHEEWESIDCLGGVYLDYNGDTDTQIVETMGLDVELISN